MRPEEALRPYGGQEQEAESAAGTHLIDYWQIVSRRLWLVLLIFAVTTASAVWAVSRQRTFYQARMALQVNDPLQRTRSIAPHQRLSAQDIFIDPIQSEIEVLKASPVASTVVDSLGLRLVAGSEDVPRSYLVEDVRVAADAGEGAFTLSYGADGREAALRDAGGGELARAQVGSVLDAGLLRFTPRPPPREARDYPLQIIPRDRAVNLVRARLSATPRENTNIIDVTYTSPDPLLAPRILNGAGQALREYGARRFRVAASAEVRFIEERLDSARAQLARSLAAIEEFKRTRAFTDLSAEEQALVNQAQDLGRRIEEVEAERTVFRGLLDDIRTGGVKDVDIVNLATQLGASANPSIANLIGQVRDLQQARREALTTGRRAEGHPQVRAIDEQLAQVEEELVAAVRSRVQSLERRLEALARQLRDIHERQRAFPELESRLQTLELQQDVDQGTYQFLLSQLYQARITEAVASPYVDIIDPAVGAAPIGPRGRMNVLLGALLGLLLGIGAAFFLEYLDQTVRTTSDVEALLAIPVLGVIPRLRRSGSAAAEDSGIANDLPLIVALDPLDPAAEAYRNLRMNLTFMSTEDEPVRSVTFSSPGPDEGKSTSAMNFAVMMAQQGQRVLLVDADLRRPIIHRALELLREPGLTNLVVGDARPREAVRPNVLPNLDVLPAGPFPPNPSELLNSRTMRRILEGFEARYDAVIVDSPPVLAVTDASVLGSQTDGIVLVLRAGETEQRSAERACDQLRRIGVRVLGAVLNEVSPTSSEEGYYLQYYYSYSDRQRRQGAGRLREGLQKVRFW